LAFGVWRVAWGVGRVASGIGRWALGVWRRELSPTLRSVAAQAEHVASGLAQPAVKYRPVGCGVGSASVGDAVGEDRKLTQYGARMFGSRSAWYASGWVARSRRMKRYIGRMRKAYLTAQRGGSGDGRQCQSRFTKAVQQQWSLHQWVQAVLCWRAKNARPTS
jgi:hypothetical protein